MSSNDKRKANKWLVFASMPFQMGVTIYLFYWAGQWLDGKYGGSGEWWMKAFTMLGVIVSLYHFIRLVNYVNRDE
ncbi:MULTISPECIES: AtpZ/AtpI family protein [Sphingobacterium]|uniref:AtpZ/AtpI family protein n=1 Tax=Sphingobacterium populi TaxID=1812824 RepID=A0ABW5UEI3_9SPHI|nr:AtpZ/AtpI family protein [Sphingobacterium sp. CFCC 11742]